VDPVSLAGFSSTADAYAAARPHWPVEAVDIAFGRWGLDPATARAVDLAAGTGRLTEELAKRCGDVVAVEPVGEMRAHISATPDVRAGTAEDLPLRDGEAAAVFVAEAYHWFDPDPALPEIARVLRPAGGLAILWNNRVGSSPWDGELTRLLRRYHYHPQGRRLDGTDPAADMAWQQGPQWDGWEPLTHVRVEHVEHLTRATAVLRIASFSYIGRLDPDTRSHVLAEVDAIYQRHGAEDFEHRWRCDLYLTRVDASASRAAGSTPGAGVQTQRNLGARAVRPVLGADSAPDSGFTLPLAPKAQRTGRRFCGTARPAAGRASIEDVLPLEQEVRSTS
jgi:SAM-dependent methyltransferase